MHPGWHFDHATVSRPTTGPVLRDVTWTLEPGRVWAVVGPVASGKTTLAETLLGRHRVESGQVRRPLGEPGLGVKLVGFREDSRLFSYARHYYQQRFNFLEPDDDRRLSEFLAVDSGSDLPAILGRLQLTDLLDRSLIQLSNGQMRRARLARALLGKPAWLILDDPFIGLDMAGREEVSRLLAGLVESGQNLLLITRADAIPEWVTDVLEMRGGVVTWQGPRAAYAGPRLEPASTLTPGRSPGDEIVRLEDVTVRYGPTVALAGVTWTVRAGECWAVLGPNGAGKTTLLSLLCGDHPQAYSNEVHLFGRRRGTGETIWDIKRNVGLLSPEFHLYFTEPLTARETAGTGFHDALVYRPLTSAQSQRVETLFAELAPEVPLDRPFSRLSSGEQRLVLLVRALVKEMPLLILDEPFQTLDPETIARARAWLASLLGADQTLLFVTHQPAELPGRITHRLTLNAGRVS